MVHGLPLNVSASLLPETLHEELSASCRGPVYLRGDPSFLDYTKIFNGNVTTTAKAVVCPLDANDISKVVLFCNKHDLSLSVKAGGYGTAGWAIAGDIILDLQKLVEVDIETPHPDGSFTSLKDVAAANSKGKQPASSSASGSGKRRREDDAEPHHYDPSSRVEQFLHGPQVSKLDNTDPPPTVRRRFGHSTSSSQSNIPPSLPAGGDALDDVTPDGVDPPTSTQPTPATTVLPPSPPVIIHEPAKPSASSVRSSADPFGYLDHPSNFPPVPPPTAVQSFNNPHAMLNLWGTANESPLLTDSSGPFAQMNIFTQPEPIYPHVFVSFGSGMRQKEIDTYSAKNPIEARYPNGSVGSIPYHIPFAAHPTGSSIMLLGGFGFLGRLHGLSVDNLVEVEMVLADGRIVIISANDYPDLWWAIRGAGPAFGIATRYKAKAYPVPVVFAGNLIYRFNKATAPSLIKHFRDCVKGAPRELYANILLTAGPAGKDSLMVVQMCYIGPREKGQEYLTAISSWDGEQCLLNEVDEKSFLHQQDSVAQVLRGKAGRQWFIRSALISSLPDDIINDTVMQFSNTPVGCTWLFELAGGAIADYEDTCIPKSQREAPFTVAALHQWDMNVDDDRCIQSAEMWIAETLKSVHIGGPYPSFLGRHEPPSRVKACFGTNWERLRELKKLYDPKNLFKHNFWPLNDIGEEVDPRTHEPPTPHSFD